MPHKINYDVDGMATELMRRSWSLNATALGLGLGLVVSACGDTSATGSPGKAVEPDARSEQLLSNKSDGGDWPAFGRTYDEGHYSPLRQITTENVDTLGLVWASDIPTSISSVATPLEVGGVLFVTYGLSIVQAMDARSGRILWNYDPQVGAAGNDAQQGAWGTRGLAWWNGKIYVGTMDGRLIALNAASGKPVWSVQTTTPGDGLFISGPPRVFAGKVIVGNGGADFGGVRGYVTAYDAETGTQAWRFYTVPGDPNEGFENDAMRMAATTWKGEWWKLGGGGTVWNAITYDKELERIYIGTGNGSPWNRDLRSPGGGDNLFLCSIVALDADTGRYLWHYQTTPGESWDYNSSMDIQLATLRLNGADRRVILHAPKNGFFYVIDRDRGKLISAEPFSKTTWARSIDLTTGRPIENPAAHNPTEPFTIMPSAGGAHNWHPMAFSPQTGLVYLPTTENSGTYDPTGLTAATWRREGGMRLNTGFNMSLATIPTTGASARPSRGSSRGSIQAWDPVRQRRVWSAPLSAPVNGGVAATAGGLVFQGQADGWFVARDARDGRIVWRFQAQNGILAAPITYLVNGRQYVTVMTGFGGAAAAGGPAAAALGWDYRTQKRRVLTFALGGRASLPPAPKAGPVTILHDASFVIDPAKVQAGARIYSERCFACHGALVVAGGNAPDLRASAIPLDADSFAAVVREGILKSNGMPQFADLTAADLEALRHLIRSRAEESLAAERPRPGATRGSSSR